MRPPAPIIPRLAWAGRVTLLASSEGWGKSTFARAGAAAVTTGQAFLDGAAMPPGDVLWARLEESEYDCMMGVSGATRFGADPNRFLVWTPGPAPVAELIARMQELRPALTVIDSIQVLATLAGVESLDDAAQMGRALGDLEKIGREVQTAMLWLGQGSKATGKYRNSSWLGHTADLVLEVQKPENDTTPIREFLVPKRRLDVFGYRVKLVGARYELTTARAAATDRLEVLRAILTDTPQTPDQLAERLERKVRGVQQDLQQLYRDGKAARTGSGRKGDAFLFAGFPHESPTGSLACRNESSGCMPADNSHVQETGNDDTVGELWEDETCPV